MPNKKNISRIMLFVLIVVFCSYNVAFARDYSFRGISSRYSQNRHEARGYWDKIFSRWQWADDDSNNAADDNHRTGADENSDIHQEQQVDQDTKSTQGDIVEPANKQTEDQEEIATEPEEGQGAAGIESEDAGAKEQAPAPESTPASVSAYPLHRDITATVFWVGEPVGNGSSEDNALSAYDDNWQSDYGGFDDPYCRQGCYPCGFTPKENPFYVTVPYSDFNDNGDRKANAYTVVPWANEKTWADNESMMKNQWVEVTKDGTTCYAQVEDAGPYVYNDYNYVFGNAKPQNTRANNAGMDVSPALRDCLGFNGLNNDENKVDWQFVNADEVPAGPWTEIITTSLINW